MMGKKIAMAVAVLVVSSVCICRLRSVRGMDVVGSLSFSCADFMDESIRVCLNGMAVTGKAEDIAGEIIQRVLDNGFHTVKFNFDRGYPNRLKVSVYKDEEGMRPGDMLFSFTYGPVGTGDHDISQAGHMRLEIHDR